MQRQIPALWKAEPRGSAHLAFTSALLVTGKSGQLQCLAVGDQPLHSLMGGLVSLLWDEAHNAPSENVRGKEGWPQVTVS